MTPLPAIPLGPMGLTSSCSQVPASGCAVSRAGRTQERLVWGIAGEQDMGAVSEALSVMSRKQRWLWVWGSE